MLEEARDLGFLGPGPVAFHVEHARAYLPLLVDAAGPALDLGTGGGVPGLVLAVERPDLDWILLDSRERPTAFLRRAVTELGLSVAVRTDRAEDLADLRGVLGVVVARGFGPPPVTAECAAPLLRVGGRLLVAEPPDDVPRPARWPANELERLGFGPAEQHVGPPALVVLHQVAQCPPEYPRRSGVPRKRLLW